MIFTNFYTLLKFYDAYQWFVFRDCKFDGKLMILGPGPLSWLRFRGGVSHWAPSHHPCPRGRMGRILAKFEEAFTKLLAAVEPTPTVVPAPPLDGVVQALVRKAQVGRCRPCVGAHSVPVPTERVPPHSEKPARG